MAEYGTITWSEPFWRSITRRRQDCCQRLRSLSMQIVRCAVLVALAIGIVLVVFLHDMRVLDPAFTIPWSATLTRVAHVIPPALFIAATWFALFGSLHVLMSRRISVGDKVQVSGGKSYSALDIAEIWTEIDFDGVRYLMFKTATCRESHCRLHRFIVTDDVDPDALDDRVASLNGRASGAYCFSFREPFLASLRATWTASAFPCALALLACGGSIAWPLLLTMSNGSVTWLCGLCALVVPGLPLVLLAGFLGVALQPRRVTFYERAVHVQGGGVFDRSEPILLVENRLRMPVRTHRGQRRFIEVTIPESVDDSDLKRHIDGLQRLALAGS